MTIDLVSSVNTIILYGNFALFITFLRCIPFVGSILSFLVYSIVMSYYCFEYKWINQDWTMEQRMVYAEEHWAYCLGFGLPATTLIFFLSTLRAGGVFALIYPSYIMMASIASPEPLSTHVAHSAEPLALPFRVPVFFAIRLMNQAIIQAIRTLGGSKGATFVVEKKKDNLGKLV
ncbi:etoposide-induced protein 2.4-domain-containing protein [Mucor lusitanicus]|uniref:Etoposide-induced protein 2.4-domain-containing protein n=1 Tax=Mucor circinelloides f. lusitanicus TaxID=29924 RepID=A0A8H4F1R6_MUCCL|nr:etoposide-induced protein 2.4-domain-containing protein [Mucor lusitanicus]